MVRIIALNYLWQYFSHERKKGGQYQEVSVMVENITEASELLGFKVLMV